MEPKTVVAAIIIDRGEVLCVQKPQTKYDYTSFHWEYPGGKVEQGETEENALRRELQEEMDYSIDVIGLLSSVEHSYPDFSIRLRFYLCVPSNRQQPRRFVLKEHHAFRWVRMCDVPFISELDPLHQSWCAADHILTPHESIVDHLNGLLQSYPAAIPEHSSLTPFRIAVWKSICRIPYGETRTYKELAQMAGYPSAIRAVASACGANPLPYYIPCHRVVGAHSIGGYAYGVEIKKRLLALER